MHVLSFKWGLMLKFQLMQKELKFKLLFRIAFDLINTGINLIMTLSLHVEQISVPKYCNEA